MDGLGESEFWLMLAVVAALAFFIGRASARGGGEARREDRAERAMRAQLAAAEAFAAMAPAKQAEVDRLVGENRLIEAIKLVREETRLGLKDSKDIVDERRRMLRGA